MKTRFLPHLAPQLLRRVSGALLGLMLLAGLPVGYAQQVLEGVVCDASSGAFLSGANIAVSNSAYGTISTGTGSFRINTTKVTFPVELVITRSGYQTKTLTIANAAQPVRIGVVKVGEKEGEAIHANVAEYRNKLDLLKGMLAQAQWAADPNANDDIFIIGIVGYNPFDQSLYGLEDIRVHNAPVEVKFVDVNDLSSVTLLNAVFVSQPDKNTATQLQKLLWGTDVLTIGDRNEGTGFIPILTLTYNNHKAGVTINKSLAGMAGISFPAADPSAFVAQ